MQVHRITAAAELEPLAERWNRLTRGVPFRRFEWLRNWWRYYGDGRELFVLCVTDSDGSLVGLAPWFVDGCRSGGRVVKFLGSGEVCSDYLSILSAEGREDDVAAALAEWLTLAVGRAREEDRWDLLHLTGVDVQDRAVGRLIEHLWNRGNSVHRRAEQDCWRIALPESWDAYLAALSKSHRKQVRRLQRRAIETGRAVLHTAGCPEDLRAGMGILIDLHRRRRRSLGETGCFASKRFSDFLCRSARQLLDAGLLGLHWLELDGRPVAAEFHLEGDGVTYAYQAGVDPEAMDEEPGRLINIATIKRAIERGRRAFDFLRGDEPYKAHWRARPRGNADLRIVPRRASSRLRHGVWLAGDRVKDWIKSGLHLAGMN